LKSSNSTRLDSITSLGGSKPHCNNQWKSRLYRAGVGDWLGAFAMSELAVYQGWLDFHFRRQPEGGDNWNPPNSKDKLK